MKRPEVNVDNYKEVYEFYANYKPNPIVNRTIHRAMGLVFNPSQIVYEGMQSSNH